MAIHETRGAPQEGPRIEEQRRLPERLHRGCVALSRPGWTALLLAALAASLLPGWSEAQQGEVKAPLHGYFYKGKLIELTASQRLVAVSEAGPEFGRLPKTLGLVRDALSDREPLKGLKLGLYFVPGAPRGDLSVRSQELAAATGEVVQPVFEQGESLLIPARQLIVGFRAATSLEEAQRFIARHRVEQGVVDVKLHRRNTYLLTIDRPGNGRVYRVSQFLAGLPEVRFAEPDHVVVPLDRPVMLEAPLIPGLFEATPAPGRGGPPARRGARAAAAGGSVAWTTLVDEGCDGATLPAGWSTGRLDATHPDAYWSVTSHRQHAGSGSCYATGGGSAGVAPPGDYPDKVWSWLDTPTLDLASYEEVYVEFWFYAKFGLGGPLDDLGAVAIHEPATGATRLLDLGQFHGVILGLPSGDLTADPTTDRGWRRALFRLPPALRLDGVEVRFIFKSNDSLTAEGLYVDQIRVVGAADVDTAPIGNDTYGARLYEMKNSAQIAGLGNGNHDMSLPAAWALVAVSPAVVVAVIDAGVDLTHPDLNLVTGYEPDGTVGGGPRLPHGTAVAGNVGAIRNNSIGVMGTAPGVKIMPVFLGWQHSEQAAAIDVAVAHGASILTNSWGWADARIQVIEDAVVDALSAGRTVLFAAGNGPDRAPWTYDVVFPASLCGSTDVICVGASSPTDEYKGTASSDGSFLWGSSYVGVGPDVVAPSPWSYTTDIQGAGGYNPDPSSLAYSLIDPADPSSESYAPAFGGTSSATPKVAGVAALLLSADPTLTPASVKRILRETADDIDAPGVDDKTGAGRVNAARAVLAALPSGEGLRTGLSIHAGAAIPTGTLNNTTDPGPTVNVDFVYAITPRFGVDARLGYSRLARNGGGDDLVLADLSLNLKYAPVLSSPWLFVNGGLGLYEVDWNDLHGGANVGVGLGRRVTPRIDFEATVNLHRTFTASQDLGFVKVQVGVILSF